MSATPRHPIVCGGALLLALAVSACTQVADTIPQQSTGSRFDPACYSALGGYYLPKALIRFTATKDDSAPSLSGTLAPLPLTMVADRLEPHAFCLDYLSLPTSQDVVTVQRDPFTGLLTSISSDVIDRTPQIAQALIATAENATLAATRQTSLTTIPPDTLDIEFDPFMPPELEAAKIAMRRFGFCLYVEGHSFPIDELGAAGILSKAQAWCDFPGLPPYRDPAVEFAALPVPTEAMASGILYRPNMTHKIVILYKKDPRGREPWVVFQVKRLEMPNVSPILSIGVTRATFTERQTTLNFNEGVLTDVAVNKKSELAGFVSIPLAIAQAVASLPQQIVTLRISDLNNQVALLNAQNSLLQAVGSYQQTVAANPLPSGAPQSGWLRGGQLYQNGQLLGGCLDAHGPPSDCATLTQQ